MIFNDKEFIPVLLGGDVSNYSMARSFYEAFKIKSIVAGKQPIYPTTHTKLIDGFYNEKIEEPSIFLSMMNEIDTKFPNKTKILLGNNDNYVRLIIENKDKLSKNFIAPYIDIALFERLIVKEKFYEMCEKYGLDYPKTYVYKCSNNNETSLKLPFPFPVVIKPSDTVKYSKYSFDGKKKGYIAKNNDELINILAIVNASGYNDSLIIQDFIPGDDSNMRVITCYSNKLQEVKGIAMGHILLEDHAPMLVGNYAAMIGEYDQSISDKMVKFLQSIKFTGICHFDIKYDTRDHKYKVLEMNIRQGRNNYYTTGCGLNLAEYLVNDYIYKKDMPLKVAEKECINSIIPKIILFKYIKDKDLLIKVKKAIKNKHWIRPLLMKGDYNIARLLYHLKSDIISCYNFNKYLK